MVGYKVLDIPVDSVILDEENPRIRPELDMYSGKPTVEQMSLALGAEHGQEGGGTTYDRLKTSILVNRGIIQPILVRKIRNQEKYKCIEGNTRVAIYKQLEKDPKAIGNDWKTIPALVFNEEMTEKDIDAVRLQLHLVGTREWRPYAKAKYLHFLYKEAKMTEKEIVDYCGGNTKSVMDDIKAYEDMEKYYRTYVNSINETFDATRFSGFRESVKPSIRGAMGKAGYTMEDFATWIHPPSSGIEKAKIHPLGTVRSLPRILGNEKATEIFCSEGAKKAIIYLDVQDDKVTSGLQVKDANIEQLAEAFRSALFKMDYETKRQIEKSEDSTNVMKDIADVILDEFV